MFLMYRGCSVFTTGMDEDGCLVVRVGGIHPTTDHNSGRLVWMGRGDDGGKKGGERVIRGNVHIFGYGAKRGWLMFYEPPLNSE